MDRASVKHWEQWLKPNHWLQKGSFDPALHYQTRAQAALWQEVFQRHAPLAQRRVLRLYRSLAQAIAQRYQGTVLRVVSLGVGTGTKERWVLQELHRNDNELEWVPVDASLPLLLEATVPRRLPPLQRLFPLLADFREAPRWSQSLQKELGAKPTVYTLFGLLPNYRPREFFPVLRKMLGEKDRAWVSANLVPGGSRTQSDYKKAVESVLSQYDNSETRRWLTEILREWGLQYGVNDCQVSLVPDGILYAISVTVTWKGKVGKMATQESIPDAGTKNLELFRSYRYTPELFEQTVREFKLHLRNSWIAPSQEEGIWEVSLP